MIDLKVIVSPRKNAFGEYVVRVYKNGIHYKPADYFTTEKLDAVETANQMRIEMKAMRYTKRNPRKKKWKTGFRARKDGSAIMPYFISTNKPKKKMKRAPHPVSQENRLKMLAHTPRKNPATKSFVSVQQQVGDTWWTISQYPATPINKRNAMQTAKRLANIGGKFRVIIK